MKDISCDSRFKFDTDPDSDFDPEEERMNTYSALYDFAASAGALEGYVYHKTGADQLDMAALPIWVDNLSQAHEHLSADIRAEIQAGCDQTLGRAIRSLVPVLGRDHEVIRKLSTLVRGPLPDSAQTFNKKKWFQEDPGPEIAQ